MTNPELKPPSLSQQLLITNGRVALKPKAPQSPPGSLLKPKERSLNLELLIQGLKNVHCRTRGWLRGSKSACLLQARKPKSGSGWVWYPGTQKAEMGDPPSKLESLACSKLNKRLCFNIQGGEDWKNTAVKPLTPHIHAHICMCTYAHMCLHVCEHTHAKIKNLPCISTTQV